MRLGEFRRAGTVWRICVLNGPNVAGQIGRAAEFDTLLGEWGAGLGVEVTHFRSNHGGALLEEVHRGMGEVDGYLVNPGGLTGIGEALRHVLKETRRPVVEVHGDNDALPGSVFAPSVTGVVSGLGRFSYLGALAGLVLALDDPDFLHPGGSSPINRAHGSPRSLFQG